MEDNKNYAPDYLSSTEDFVYLEHLHSWIIHENAFPEINFNISRFAQYAGDINGDTIDDLILNMGDADLEISGRKYVYGAVNRQFSLFALPNIPPKINWRNIINFMSN